MSPWYLSEVDLGEIGMLCARELGLYMRKALVALADLTMSVGVGNFVGSYPSDLDVQAPEFF